MITVQTGRIHVDVDGKAINKTTYITFYNNHTETCFKLRTTEDTLVWRACGSN